VVELADTLTKIPAKAARPAITVDIVALTIRSGRLVVMLVERLLPPFQGGQSLPGGFVLPGETLRQAALRELSEETGVAPPGHLEQLRTYGPLNRDPRGPVLTVAYLLLAPDWGDLKAGSDAQAAAWVDVEEAHGLAFDHDQILTDGLERSRAKLEYSALALAFMPPSFTMAQLRSVYQAVWGHSLDPRNFSRKVLGSGIVEPTGAMTSSGVGRPAALYSPTDGLDIASAVLNPPIMRLPVAQLQGR
jgi:8-oxo-dGTP diphosphatase